MAVGTLDNLQSLIQKNNLSIDEVDYLVRVLGSLSRGDTREYDKLWASDYEEIPVDILTFVTDPLYLGKSWVDENGKLLIYRYWINVLRFLFSPEGRSKYEVAFSGAIGLGKTNIAVTGMTYILYNLLCLKDPASYYKLRKGSSPALGFLNVTLDQSYGVGFKVFQSLCLESEWFRAHGTVLGRGDNQTYYPGKNIEWVVGSNNQHFIGRDIFCALLDELNFRQGQADDIAKSGVMKLYSAISDRMTNRFMSYGQMPGKLFLVSSKNMEHDFLEEYIKHQIGKPQFYLVDEPVWNVINAEKLGLSGQNFRVAVGDRYAKSRILSDSEDVEAVSKHQRVIDVPVEYRNQFDLDIDGALSNFAGIAISSASKFFNMEKVDKACKSYLNNPFTTNVIRLGFDDETELKDFFIPEKMSRTSITRPHYLHWDVSITGDSTGLSLLVPSGSLKIKRLDGLNMIETHDVTIKVVFAIRITKMPGQEIPFHKIRKFIYYLRDEMGIPIRSISCDSFQSRDTLQAFRLNGFDATILSVDTSKGPYYALKNAVNEGRLLMPEIKELLDEFENVQENSKKIDHTSTGSKDILDTIAANVFKISQSYTEGDTSTRSLSVVLEGSSSSDQDEENYDSWNVPEGMQVVQQNLVIH